MKVGVVYPQIELGGDPNAVRRIGKAVEDLGFDYLLAYDHVLGAVHDDRTPPLPGPYTERDPFHDPFVMFGYLAGITERIGLATGVLVLRNVRQHWWPARPPTSICFPEVDSASEWASAGTMSSIKPSDRTSAVAVHAKKSRSTCFDDCSSNPLLTSRGGSTRWTGPPSSPNPRIPFRFGSADQARRHLIAQRGLPTASSSSARAAST